MTERRRDLPGPIEFYLKELDALEAEEARTSAESAVHIQIEESFREEAAKILERQSQPEIK